MRAWIDLFENVGNPTVLYHFTPAKFIRSVQSGGLDPHFRQTNSPIREGDKNIYLAADVHQAAGYIYYHEVSDGFILAIPVSQLDHSLLGPDDVDLADLVDDDWREYSWQDSLKISGQCAYKGKISPQSITVHSYVLHDGTSEVINQSLADLSPKWVK